MIADLAVAIGGGADQDGRALLAVSAIAKIQLLRIERRLAMRAPARATWRYSVRVRDRYARSETANRAPVAGIAPGRWRLGSHRATKPSASRPHRQPQDHSRRMSIVEPIKRRSPNRQRSERG